METPGLRVVALGGGHGLAAALAAWRRLTAELTAVVTVADDGGSSGRIRREMPVLPPGDLRMALVALAGESPRTQQMADLLQHRFGGTGVLAGHPVGNLMLTGLTEMHGGDTVRALGVLEELLGTRGRVLPMADVPLDLVATVASVDPDDPQETRRIRGQVAIASTPGHVEDIRVSPADPPVPPEVLAAIAAADVVSLGPGSWYTSVLPHLLVPRLRTALAETAARVVVVLNLEPQAGETDGFSPEEHLRVLLAHLGGVSLHTVIADTAAVVDRRGLLSAVHACGAELVLAPVAAPDGTPQHDPSRLAAALASVVGAR
ncbi:MULTISPECIES: gluconeogenesis factor YvcK family protein [unclassified Modestobacter]|uniref:gluconeogenesis factor YvcK family protein n=1 Tax=unclassified Modestobacter TaxID=2643866 RepID=UPI0022AA40C0|nr:MULTISPECIES: uridine diphosphate-N-acetylglucosamine-binding protein YvcK [unclassified Modestobacter]MCZ2814382.1 uridine diphosphate-N-acetylglucosamine-binding protein YvcK [Modestobacter sp. VKM Ac-2979]MCZ2843926.1 uridine diphosphate-N-acetylglucosamine-binding protein YvcK [Modestobacter sp. VKM Ac-2980]MCZ2850605.1 uridine diphosphate-N-acetylglucosamine-binding protein YvcK [Modestobacter sp. VKM Ac-2978]